MARILFHRVEYCSIFSNTILCRINLKRRSKSTQYSWKTAAYKISAVCTVNHQRPDFGYCGTALRCNNTRSQFGLRLNKRRQLRALAGIFLARVFVRSPAPPLMNSHRFPIRQSSPSSVFLFLPCPIQHHQTRYFQLSCERGGEGG